MNPSPPATSVLDALSFEHDPDLHCQSPIIKTALAAWEKARGGRAMPSRSDIDPLQLPATLLPHILLIDVEYEPRLRFRWRLIGTYITNILGRDSTGKYWDELYDEGVLTSLISGPNWVLQHQQPLRTTGAAPVSDKEFLHSENVEMPLSNDGKTVDVIMVASDYN